MAKRKPQKPSRKSRPQNLRPQNPRRVRPGLGAERSQTRRGRPASAPGGHWLFGAHAVLAALANPRRRVRRLLVTAEAGQRHEADLKAALAGRADRPSAETAGRELIDGLLPEGAVHQGLALECAALGQPDLETLLAEPAGPESRRLLVALDQVTDPHNVGAILRSAAAFGAAAVLATRDHAAPETGVLAKAASGALEHVPYVQVTNLARALDRLRDADFWVLGLAADSETRLADWRPAERTVLVLGAEGSGLRRLTRERCDQLVRLPTGGPIGQLNVSNAAAVALYELSGRRG